MRYILAFPLLLIGLQLPGFADTILPGTEIRVRADRPMDVARWDRGRIYPGHVAQDVYAADGDLVIPRGSYAELIVRQEGPDRMAVDLESVTANGRRYVMDAEGPNFHMADTQYRDGAGLVGGIIGAIAGAAGVQVQAQGNRIYIPEDSVVTFRLQEPLHTVGWSDPGYMNNGSHYHRDPDWYR